MKIDRLLHVNVASLVGIGICGFTAILLCFLGATQHWRQAIPVAFLFIILIVALRCGAAAGVLGSILGAVIFACFLYQPIGSVGVANKSARETLAWMLLGGLVLSYLLGITTEDSRPN